MEREKAVESVDRAAERALGVSIDDRAHGGGTARIDAAAEWRSGLTQLTCALLLGGVATGLVIYLAPFSEFVQFMVIVHTVAGIIMVVPTLWYLVRHWRVRRHGNLSHYQLLGYFAAALLGVCLVSGFVVTWQGAAGPRVSYAWDVAHLISSIAFLLVIAVHLATVIFRKTNNPEARHKLSAARWSFYRGTSLGAVVPLIACAAWASLYGSPEMQRGFPASYNWTFGEDRPFAPSLSRVDHGEWESQLKHEVLQATNEAGRAVLLASFSTTEIEPVGLFERITRCLDDEAFDQSSSEKILSILEEAGHSMRRTGAIDARALAGSAGCGTSGCHSEIYEEWLPSAHRYSSMDDMFQRVQQLMAVETSPEHTRYCAGCHDPISLFSGAKNADNVTLSALGADEGTSCLVCHSIVQTDVQGNGDYTIRPPSRYAYELDDGPVSKFVSDFLIRTYPDHHVSTYARALYKTPEFCGACHKQYVDKEVNTDIGKVQGQNQYDSWKNSRWYHESSPEQSLSCRECHMPLMASDDPARGDETDYNRTRRDQKHRSHRMLASNQYMPLALGLEGAREHVELTEAWLRGEYAIPEIAHKWTEGPVVRLEIIAPETVQPGDLVPVRVTLTNNKTGHDFPTGPLDMIESWVELHVVDDSGRSVYHIGGLDEAGNVQNSPVQFKADGFDRKGELIDRHNLWDLVGASYKRSMHPGVTDSVEVEFLCPSMARGRVADTGARVQPGGRVDDFSMAVPDDFLGTSLRVTASLWYRKANPEFLNRVYGVESRVRSPATEISRAETTVRVSHNVAQRTE